MCLRERGCVCVCVCVCVLTRVVGSARASGCYQSKRCEKRPTAPDCPTRPWTGHKWTDAAQRSDTYSPPGLTSLPAHTGNTPQHILK